MGEVGPYPWDRLPRLRRADAAVLTAASRYVGPSTPTIAESVERAFAALGLPRPTVELRSVCFAQANLADRAARFALHMPGVDGRAVLAIDRGLIDTLNPAGSDVAGLVAHVLAECTRAGLPPVVVEPETSKPPDGRGVEVAGIVEIEGLEGWVQLFVPKRWLRRAPRRKALRRLATLAAGRVVHTCPLVIARTGLTATELAELRPGDAVLFERHAFDHGDLRATRLAALEVGGGVALPISLMDDGRWGGRLTTEDEMEDAGEETTQLLESAEIGVDVRVGRVSLTLDQLSRLAPGQVLTADREVGDDVELVANGTTIAIGELVDVEGVLGVRLVELA